MKIFKYFCIKNFIIEIFMENNLKNQISSILPDHDEADENYDFQQAREAEVEAAVDATIQKRNAATIARLKLKEKQELHKIEMRKTDPTYGMTKKQKEKYEQQEAIAKENLATLEVIEDSKEAQNFLSGADSDISPYTGPTKRDVLKLLSSLNINLNVRLSRTDTYNLVSCLLTCNETQLDALYKNEKVPLAIKTVIKRLKEDAKLGNIDTIERLWDRIFGKADKAMLEMPQGFQPQVTQGIIPNTLVTREAYMIIRDTIIGK